MDIAVILILCGVHGQRMMATGQGLGQPQEAENEDWG